MMAMKNGTGGAEWLPKPQFFVIILFYVPFTLPPISQKTMSSWSFGDDAQPLSCESAGGH